VPRTRDPPDVVVRVEGEAGVAVGWGEELFRARIRIVFQVPSVSLGWTEAE